MMMIRTSLLLIALILNSGVFSQSAIKVEVSFDKKVVLLFPQNIEWHELGSTDQTDIGIDEFRCVLQANEELGTGYFPTNLQISTEDGHYYVFELVYNNSTTNTLIPIKAENSVYKRDVKRKKPEVAAGDNTIKSRGVIDQILENERSVFGTTVQGMTYLFMGTYNTDSHVYFHIKVENKTDIPFDLDLISFFLEKKGAGKRKKSTSSKEAFTHGDIINGDIRIIDRDSSVDYICVFPKFTMDSDKRFLIEIHELEGDRDGVLELKPYDITSSQYIRKNR